MRTNANKTPRAQEEVEVVNPFAKPKNIQIIDDKNRGMAIVRIYGGIEEPEEYIEELAKLDYLATQYDAVEITLNSPGGSLNTTVDLASIINNFKYVITIGKGEIASAAFMLWTMGDVKVVTDYSMYMAHRESYGMYGKTSEHKHAADIFGVVYEELFEECFGTILNDKEKQIAERSEAWISYKDLRSREGIISFDEYIEAKNPYQIGEIYKTQDGKTFMFDGDTETYRSVTCDFGMEYITDMTDYLYGIANVTKFEKPKKLKKIKVKTPKSEKKKKKSKKKD
jgi:ATP-dependent protease ClpP protease subunit